MPASSCADDDGRDARCQPEPRPSSRTEAERDRDRVLYSPSFRRLAEVTQVVAPTSGYVFHNRLTHTLEVAQVGRRIAERLLRVPGNPELAAEIGGLSPDVVECAALVHDLGHPPFGHIAEKELQVLLREAGAPDEFEGNAQSFRIVTTTEVQRRQVQPGLNLTRATLNASLKYPWLKPKSDRGMDGETFKRHSEKWGAYDTEEAIFDWVRKGYSEHPFHRCVEAEIMDWADDIAYSVHDVEDFFRAGMIPLDRIFTNYGGEQDRFLEGARARLSSIGVPEEGINDMAEALGALIVGVRQVGLGVDQPYRDTRAQRALLNELKSLLISRYVRDISLRADGRPEETYLNIPEQYRREVGMLKELVWFYIINGPELSSRQHGQRLIISTVFDIMRDWAANENQWPKLPIRYREALVTLRDEGQTDDASALRVVTDLVAGLTEKQAEELYRVLTGAGASQPNSGAMT